MALQDSIVQSLPGLSSHVKYAFSVSDVCYRLEHSRVESLAAYSALTGTNVIKAALNNLVSVLQ